VTLGLVVVTDHLFEHLEIERELLGAAGHELRFDGNVADPDEIVDRAGDADAVLNCDVPLPAQVIRRLENCRVIARYGIGVDSIDIDAATAHGILVTNVPDYCIDEVSDHALALILSLARAVTRLDRSVRAGTWDIAGAPKTRRLRGRTLGLVGFGRIARALAAKAAAIGLVVSASDPYVPDDEIRAAGVKPQSLSDLLQTADIVSIHVPLTSESRNLIDRARLALMKPDALLVNTSRGSVVDTAALQDALNSGDLAGAGLDVLEIEPPDTLDPLLRREDVVVTPHAAFFSEESVAEVQRKAAEQVVAALAGSVPPYALNAEGIASGWQNR
jgi:D-3-phosphoglycerate dehydrogenase / 2-oxoglutarate reductase